MLCKAHWGSIGELNSEKETKSSAGSFVVLSGAAFEVNDVWKQAQDLSLREFIGADLGTELTDNRSG